MDKLIFGQTITVSNKLIRRLKTKQRNKRLNSSGYKYWAKTPTDNKEAVFLGYRRLVNGWRSWEGEEGFIFESDESFSAALVCIGEHTNPFYTLVGE